MTDTFYGNLSLKVNDPSLSDGDETNFFAQGNLSLTLAISFGSGGNVTGSGILSGQYSGYAIGEQDGDDDGFSDYANAATVSVSGQRATGLQISGSFGSGGYFSY